MKLISNQPYSTLFVHYPELSSNGNYTIESPAIWNYVCNNENVCHVVFNVSGVYKYILLSVSANVEYVLSCDNSTLDYVLYDYGDFQVSAEHEILTEPIMSGTLGESSSALISLPYKRVLLLAVAPLSYDDVGTAEIRLSQPVPSFSLNQHWERDWQRRIDGSCWGITGKPNQQMMLSKTGRKRIETMVVPLGVWRHGVYETVVECHDETREGSELEALFDNINETPKIRSSFAYRYHLSDMYGVRGPYLFEFAVKLETRLYVVSQNAKIGIEGNGEVLLKTDNFSQYFQFGHSNNYEFLEIPLKAGFNRIVIYYNCPKNGVQIFSPEDEFEWPNFDVWYCGFPGKQDWIVGNYASGITDPALGIYPPINDSDGNTYINDIQSLLFLPDNFDPEEYISFESIYRNAAIAFEYKNNYVQVLSQLSWQPEISFINYACTIGFMFKYGDWNEEYNGHETSLLKWIKENEETNPAVILEVKRIGPDELKVMNGSSDASAFQLTAKSGQWHWLVFSIEDNWPCYSFTWYLDMSNNGIKPEGYTSSDGTRILFGSQLEAGGFDLMNAMAANKIFRQGEINRIFHSLKKPE